MSQQVTKNTRIVNMYLIDPDPGIDAKDSLVAVFKDFPTGYDDETTKQMILMDPQYDVHGKLKEHNDKREKLVNKDVLLRTGNKINLLPIESIAELKWEIK